MLDLFQQWHLQDIFWPDLESQQIICSISQYGLMLALFCFIFAVRVRLTHDLEY